MKDRGFILLGVMVILFLLGLEFVVLNSTSNIIVNETSNALLQGYNDNLIASGMALVKNKNFKTGEGIEPETEKLTLKASKLSIKIENPGEIQISTFCQTGGRQMRGSVKIDIPK